MCDRLQPLQPLCYIGSNACLVTSQSSLSSESETGTFPWQYVSVEGKMFRSQHFSPEVGILEGSLSHLITKLLQVRSANSTNFSNPEYLMRQVELLWCYSHYVLVWYQQEPCFVRAASGRDGTKLRTGSASWRCDQSSHTGTQSLLHCAACPHLGIRSNFIFETVNPETVRHAREQRRHVQWAGTP